MYIAASAHNDECRCGCVQDRAAVYIYVIAQICKSPFDRLTCSKAAGTFCPTLAVTGTATPTTTNNFA